MSVSISDAPKILRKEIIDSIEWYRNDILKKFRESPHLFGEEANEMDININWDMITIRMIESWWLDIKDQKNF